MSLSEVPIPCNEGPLQNLTRHLYPFDPAVIVECNERGKLLLNKCASSLYWNPFTGSCKYEPVNLNTPFKCLRMECKNGGTCALDRNKDPFCICEDGYDGKYCEINIDDCASNPCMNNATCVDGINRYHCLCQDKYVDKSCCCNDAPNPCKTVIEDLRNRSDNTVRHSHPFTKEKYLVCNLEGYAQILSCPEGLYWSQSDQTCLMKDSRELFEKYSALCKTSNLEFVYPFSALKYIKCSSPGSFRVETCPIETPYYCQSQMNCVAKHTPDCD